jgi:hypothetical protein
LPPFDFDVDRNAFVKACPNLACGRIVVGTRDQSQSEATLISQGLYYDIVNFHFEFWGGEPGEDIVAELNELITPTVDAFYLARVGRKKPLSRRFVIGRKPEPTFKLRRL